MWTLQLCPTEWLKMGCGLLHIGPDIDSGQGNLQDNDLPQCMFVSLSTVKTL